MDDIHATDIDCEQLSYEEVEHVISNKDDRTISCLTIRSSLLGICLAIGRLILNAYFHYKTNTFFMGTFHLFLLSYPLGLLLAFIIPKRYKMLNPGKFTIKEHLLVVIIAKACDPTYGLLPLDNKRVYRNTSSLNPVISIIFVSATQLMGFGIAGSVIFEHLCQVNEKFNQT
jgi:hypothetical protein